MDMGVNVGIIGVNLAGQGVQESLLGVANV
jgi:hypothetical protein